VLGQIHHVGAGSRIPDPARAPVAALMGPRRRRALRAGWAYPRSADRCDTSCRTTLVEMACLSPSDSFGQGSG
jgi:hypothetical protein